MFYWSNICFVTVLPIITLLVLVDQLVMNCTQGEIGFESCRRAEFKYQGPFGMDPMSPWTFWMGSDFKDLLGGPNISVHVLIGSNCPLLFQMACGILYYFLAIRKIEFVDEELPLTIIFHYSYKLLLRFFLSIQYGSGTILNS